jgi:chitodextrinase
MNQAELDSAKYWTTFTQIQPTYTLSAWTQLQKFKSTTPTGECHTPPALQGI